MQIHTSKSTAGAGCSRLQVSSGRWSTAAHTAAALRTAEKQSPLSCTETSLLSPHQPAGRPSRRCRVSRRWVSHRGAFLFTGRELGPSHPCPPHKAYTAVVNVPDPQGLHRTVTSWGRRARTRLRPRHSAQPMAAQSWGLNPGTQLDTNPNPVPVLAQRRAIP